MALLPAQPAKLTFPEKMALLKQLKTLKQEAYTEVLSSASAYPTIEDYKYAVQQRRSSMLMYLVQYEDIWKALGSEFDELIGVKCVQGLFCEDLKKKVEEMMVNRVYGFERVKKLLKDSVELKDFHAHNPIDIDWVSVGRREGRQS